MKIIATIEGRDVILLEDGHLSWLAKAAIDSDGVDAAGQPNNIYHDPYYQPETSLRHNGQSLNALSESYIVVPPAVIKGVLPVVLGCQARVHNRVTGKITEAVVGDIGPHAKIGEISIHCAEEVGMPSNPNNGGEDNPDMVLYEIWPGTPAVVNGVQYSLQPS